MINSMTIIGSFNKIEALVTSGIFIYLLAYGLGLTLPLTENQM